MRARSRIPDDEARAFDTRFRSLQEACETARDKEKALLKALRRQQNEALGERLKVERTHEIFEVEQNELESLAAERTQVQVQLEEFEQKETVSKYEAAELERTHSNLVSAVDEMLHENAAMVKPELLKFEKELLLAQQALKMLEDSFEHDTQRKNILTERYGVLEEEKTRLNIEALSARDALQKVSAEPERIRKQAECVQKAAEKLQQEISRITKNSKVHDSSISKQLSKRREAEEVRNNLLQKLELHCDTITHRQRDVDSVRKNVDIEKARTHQLAETKLKLETNRREADENVRHESDALSMLKKDMDTLRGRYRKKQTISNASKELLPTLRAQLADNEHLLRSHVQENCKLKNRIQLMKQDVDLAIARLLRQEGIENSKRAGLEFLLKEVAGIEDEIASWSSEERRQNKLISILSAQREMKAREAARAQVAEREIRELVKVKELVIVDMAKKANEVTNRLKEFSALYDVVKSERNKYVNLIQSSSQALAEMKEKIKILMSEVDILRNESMAKDKALAKERTLHLASQSQRDGLRLELYRSQWGYRIKQEAVEQQIVEIDKLNSVITNLEREMLRLKASYISAVETRNSNGVALIDRNDELCILYEKVNLQEQTLRSGELGSGQKDEDIRMLKLQLAELQRQAIVSRKKLPRMPALVDAVVNLKIVLEKERQITDSLCKCLESPSNNRRWRSLPGEDPSCEQLAAKIAVLEERLNIKKESLLESELVLEEITALTSKLRTQAKEGRDHTLHLARKINSFQAKIRDITKRHMQSMMATVAELSMYQATAMKLQQQKRAALIKLEEYKWRLTRNEPLTDEVTAELQRRKQSRLRAESSYSSKEKAQAQRQTNIVRTTAEPRPNAYIPDVAHGLGIPKPYSGLAPFKPSEVGSTMRHYRAPNPPKVTI